jgi:hypothetical protein
MERTLVRRDLVYRSGGDEPLTMDVYYPHEAGPSARLPAVVFVAGYNDVGYEKMLGRKFKEMAMSISWGQLVAASGIVAITYTNRKPAEDLDALLRHLTQEAASLGIDANRIGIFASSGNAALAVSALLQDGREGRNLLQCGVLLYGYTMDLDGSTGVADAAQTFRFTYPNREQSLDDLRATLPLFIVRAGQDQFPQLNESLERFLAAALRRNLPLTFVNHAEGSHAFDLMEDCDASRTIICQVLDFLRTQLTPAGS